MVEGTVPLVKTASIYRSEGFLTLGDLRKFVTETMALRDGMRVRTRRPDQKASWSTDYLEVSD